eukprot:8863370-Karenia_brevis.AAC.1
MEAVGKANGLPHGWVVGMDTHTSRPRRWSDFKGRRDGRVHPCGSQGISMSQSSSGNVDRRHDEARSLGRNDSAKINQSRQG